MNSFIGWVGGKSRLRKYIIPMIPADATRYIEVFGGAGWVLFGRDPQPGQLEVFNDFDGNLINLYRPGAVFYLDPPYVCHKNYYNVDFTEDDHRRLKTVLSGIKGRFILSYNDCDFIRVLYEGYNFVEINRKNLLSAKGNSRQDYAELLITNF